MFDAIMILELLNESSFFIIFEFKNVQAQCTFTSFLDGSTIKLEFLQEMASSVPFEAITIHSLSNDHLQCTSELLDKEKDVFKRKVKKPWHA